MYRARRRLSSCGSLAERSEGSKFIRASCRLSSVRHANSLPRITITFSIADLANYEPDPFLEDSDPALGDEDLEDPDTVSSPAHRSQQAAASGQRSKSSQKDEDDLGLDEESEDDGEHLSSHGAQPVPVRLTIVVEKPAAPEAGALVVDAVAQDGAILVEGLHRYANAAEAHGIAPRSADSDLSPYPGPPFGSLDEDLQMLVERYLEERGISQALAVFVPDYVDMKEQREYVSWLGGVKSFLEA